MGPDGPLSLKAKPNSKLREVVFAPLVVQQRQAVLRTLPGSRSGVVAETGFGQKGQRPTQDFQDRSVGRTYEHDKLAFRASHLLRGFWPRFRSPVQKHKKDSRHVILTSRALGGSGALVLQA